MLPAVFLGGEPSAAVEEAVRLPACPPAWSSHGRGQNLASGLPPVVAVLRIFKINRFEQFYD